MVDRKLYIICCVSAALNIISMFDLGTREENWLLEQLNKAGSWPNDGHWKRRRGCLVKVVTEGGILKESVTPVDIEQRG